MGSRINLLEVLSNFGVTLHGVSVRTAAYRVDAKWYNLVSVIDFSEMDPVSLDGAICDQWSVLGSMDHQQLRFGYEVFSYDCRDELFDQLTSGVLELCDISVQLARKIDALSESGYIQHYPQSDWPLFQLQANASPLDIDQQTFQSIRSANSDPGLQRYLSTVPYDSLNEAITFHMRLTHDGMRSYESDVIVKVPVFAKINEARCDFDDCSVTVKYEAHPKLAEQIFLSCTVSSTRDSSRERLKMPSSIPLSDSVFESTTKPIQDKNTRLDAALIHKKAGNICNTAWIICDLIPRKDNNPLWPLFQRFCSPQDFKNLLAIPGNSRDSENRPQRLFENRIAWFLGCFGFITLVLGTQECLRDPGTTVERGSLDLLAFHERKRVLILGACKINAPKESDYDNLSNVRALLLANTADADSFDTQMVIFTAAAETRLSKELQTSGSMIPRIVHIFDVQRLTEGIVSLGNTDKEWIFEQLSQAHRLYHYKYESNGSEF
ncbi:MAG TPA: hypothetical protein VGK24_17830 [Candidatus Angelobacter sp.]|jgi:hypothetical protein